MRISGLILFLCFSLSFVIAGSPEDLVGARHNGLANAAVTLNDEWSINSNPAGLTGIKKFTVGAGYEQRFNIKELSTKGVVIAAPFKPGIFGLSFSSFGFSNYSENIVGLAFAKGFGDALSFSVRFNYLVLHQGENYGNKSFFTAEAGFLAKVTKRITLGGHIYNPNRTVISNDYKENLPATLRIGAQYNVSEKVILLVEGFKNDLFKAEFRTGIEYHIIPELYLRGGLSTNPGNNSAGFGLNIKNMKLDFAVSYHRTLGYTPNLSLGYAF